uniref:Portal protein n=1 Tax=viral metagenome TaxID=1070528 RepID=A0A6H1ZIK2_9ZZZZ
MAKSTWEIIDARIKAMSDRNKRMDDTATLLQWDDNPYQLIKPDGTALRDAISVTPNLPKVFAHGVVADLIGGKWQTVVEGVSARRAHVIEEFVEDNLTQADEMLLEKYGIPSLFSWLCNHVCVRWAIGARWVSQIVDGEYQIDCCPVDMRWTPFVRGRWVAPITFRSKDDLEEELEGYAKLAKSGIGKYVKSSFAGEDIEVRDYWDDKVNELWVSGKLVYSQNNPWGYPPFVIVVPASGFMLRDKGYLRYEGEDILFLNAGLYKELARSISLEQTSGYAGLFPAYEYEVENPDASPSMPPPKIDETIKVNKGERHEPVPRGDINRAGQTARVDIQNMISAGAPLSPKDYNTPPSAVLLAGETELIHRLQNSRKDALGIFKSQLARMMIGQFIQTGEGETSIGRRGKKGKYSTVKLGDPDDYTISYHLSVKSKRQELANLAEFAAVYDKLPLEWNLTNILMADDPAGIIKDLELQKAKSINPAISLLEMAVQYAREASNMEDQIDADLKREQSRILTHEYVMAMRQRAQTPRIEEPKGNMQLLTSMGAGAMRGEVQARKPIEVANDNQVD